MKSSILFLLLLVLLAGTAFTKTNHPAQTVHAAETTNVYLPLITNPAEPSFAEEALAIVNEHRAAQGCAPLSMNQKLIEAANSHSQDMALKDFFSHYGSNHSTPWERIQATGYSYSQAAENIAAGNPDPANVVDGWMHSSSHRDAILDCNLKETGIGYYFLENDTGNVNFGHYWTQVFATP